MAITLAFTPDDLLRCRFAVSPLWETLAAVQRLVDVDKLDHHAPWRGRVRPVVDALELEPLVALLPPQTTQVPDFLTPPPTGPDVRIEAELERLRSTPDEQVALELTRAIGARRTEAPAALRPLLEDPATARARLADLVEHCWDALVRPWWPTVRDLLGADVAFRARRLADGGLAGLFADLHPGLRWEPGRLVVSSRVVADRSLDGAGLLLLPSAFHVERPVVMLDPPWQPTLIYTARGVAELWRAPVEPDAALARLLGRTRAALLAALDEPASTTTLARRHRLGAATVSEHLTVLRDAGLVTARRDGRRVLYERTEVARVLLGARL